eukprot:4048066-Prymnesium_polylepis.1
MCARPHLGHPHNEAFPGYTQGVRNPVDLGTGRWSALPLKTVVSRNASPAASLSLADAVDVVGTKYRKRGARSGAAVCARRCAQVCTALPFRG